MLGSCNFKKIALTGLLVLLANSQSLASATTSQTTLEQLDHPATQHLLTSLAYLNAQSLPDEVTCDSKTITYKGAITEDGVQSVNELFMDTSCQAESFIISSIGGQVFAATQLYKMLEERQIPVSVPEGGLCFSACTLIPFYASKFTAHESSIFLFHAPKVGPFSSEYFINQLKKFDTLSESELLEIQEVYPNVSTNVQALQLTYMLKITFDKLTTNLELLLNEGLFLRLLQRDYLVTPDGLKEHFDYPVEVIR